MELDGDESAELNTSFSRGKNTLFWEYFHWQCMGTNRNHFLRLPDFEYLSKDRHIFVLFQKVLFIRTPPFFHH